MDAKRTAKRSMDSLRGMVYRAETGQSGGRNALSTHATARTRFESALRAVVTVEDAEGVDAAATLSDRLTGLRQRAVDTGLLSVADVVDIEARVLS